MKYGGKTFEKHEKLIQVCLFSIVCMWYYCKKWTNAKKFHLEELCSTVHAVCECHALQQLHVLHRYLMLKKHEFHYKTMMGKHVMVTWNAAMAQRQLSTAKRGRAIAWLQDGAMQRNAAQRLNVSQRVIGRLWIRFLDMGNVTNRPRSRKSRSTTQREDRYLTKWTLRQCRVTARQVSDHLQTSISTLISDQTVRNRLRANNLWPRLPVVRPPLLQRHWATIRDWCTRHVRWKRAQWSPVLFSDESRFALQLSDSRERVYRRPGEQFADVNVNQCLLFGGGSVMVWGAFSFNNRTPLYVTDGNLNRNRYLQ